MRHSATLLALLSLTGAAAAAATEFWLAPGGDDRAGDGTRAAPWRSPARARDHLREQRLLERMADDVVIHLAAGTYVLAEPVVFGVRDSGRDGHAVVFRSASGPGRALLTSNAPVANWTRDRGKIWKAPLPGRRAVQTLYENGRRARVARTPNHVPNEAFPGAHGPYLLSESGGERSLVYKAGDLDPAGWTPSPTGELRWWGHQGKYDWGTFVCPIASIDPATRTLTFPKQDSPAAAGERYYVQGYRELLDAPGEFFADAAAGVLYYWPMDGDPNEQRIEAPQLDELVHLEGDRVGEVVHDIRFEGLAFSGTDYRGESVKIVGSPRAAAFLRHASRIEFRQCHFFNLGNLAIRMIDDGERNVVTGCWIERTGEGGIQIVNELKRAAFPEGRSRGHVISNCRIHDYHEVRTSTHWCAVQMFSVSDSEISHCEFFNSGRYAISLRGHYSTEAKGDPDNGQHFARRNRFHHLRAWRCGGDSGDMGAIHAAHLNPPGGDNLNTWEQIVISDARAEPSMNDIAPDGIFLDHPASCEHQVLRHIKVANVAGKPFRTNKNPVQSLGNVSWEPGFDERAMEYATIGLRPDFPRVYRGDPNVVVLDDGDDGYREVGEGWREEASRAAYRQKVRAHTAAAGDGSAEWRPPLRLAGDYLVSVWRPGGFENAATSARYEIESSAGLARSTVRQRSPHSQWVQLGRLPFAAGEHAVLRLVANASAGGAVLADAVRFARSGFGPGAMIGEAAWFTFDGHGQDFGSGRLVAVLRGGATVAGPARTGAGALQLDGVAQHANVPAAASLEVGTGDFSLSLWFLRRPHPAANLRLLAKGAGDDRTPGYAVFGSDTAITFVLGDGKRPRLLATRRHGGVNTWNHLVVTARRDGELRLYMNGSASPVVLDIAALRGATLDNGLALSLGRNGGDGDTGNLHWPGAIDDLRLFKRVLAPWEVDALATP